METASNNAVTLYTCGSPASHYTHPFFRYRYRCDMEAAASYNLPMGCTQTYFDKPPRQPVFALWKISKHDLQHSSKASREEK